jgi:acetyltransferase-like isoleucine patch superfamily enzyme
MVPVMAHIDPTAQVHPAAEVEGDVSIGARTRVWAHSHLRRGSLVGSDCNVGEGVLIDLDVSLGSRCKVQNHALLYRGSSIADDVFIGPSVCLTNDRFPRASNPDGGLKGIEDWTVSGVDIERGASLGAHVVVIGGCRIHAWAMVGAGSVVHGDVEAHALVVGNPARQIGWVCVCGNKLGDVLACGQCDRRYVRDGKGLRAV